MTSRMTLASLLLLACFCSCSVNRQISTTECISVRPGGFGYRDCAVGFVIGVIEDIDYQTDTRLADGSTAPTGNPLLVLDVQNASPGIQATGRLVLQLEEKSGPPWGAEPLRTGDRVLVTIVQERRASSWSCGRLRSCAGGIPDTNVVGLEAFRPALRP
jgi:hypothetical protein